MRVTKREIIIGLAGIIITAGLIGGGLWWHSRQTNQDKQQAKTSQNEDEALASGLSVSGGASSLGQLDSKQAQGTASKPGGSSSGSDLDPAQFAQYDKYKDSKDAMFGEIQVGSGPALAVGQKASLYYKVWLTNGALVDQSPVSAGGQQQPFSFTLGAHQVILGLEQGVAGMKTGGKRLVIVPPLVGYGAQGQGAIPPNAVLVFEVQLLSAQ